MVGPFALRPELSVSLPLVNTPCALVGLPMHIWGADDVFPRSNEKTPFTGVKSYMHYSTGALHFSLHLEIFYPPVYFVIYAQKTPAFCFKRRRFC